MEKLPSICLFMGYLHLSMTTAVRYIMIIDATSEVLACRTSCRFSAHCDAATVELLIVEASLAVRSL